jgi:ribosome biogenesis GTPase A
MNKVQMHPFLMGQILHSFVRYYSIVDRYVFPDENKLKTPQQLAQVRFVQSLTLLNKTKRDVIYFSVKENLEQKTKEEEKKLNALLKKKRERNLMKNWPIQTHSTSLSLFLFFVFIVSFRKLTQPVCEDPTMEIFQNFQSPSQQPPIPKSLNVCILGAPNAGKSTIINRLVGTRVIIALIQINEFSIQTFFNPSTQHIKK